MATLAINSGGGSVTTGGISYLADQYFSGGATYVQASAIANTTDDILYQSERYGNFSYAVPVTNGSYLVTLRFAEIYFNAPGQRVFDVTAEGSLVLDNLDVWSAAGGQNIAKDYVIPVNVTDGTLDLQFLSVVENAKISAIQITPAADTSTVSVTQSGGSTAVTEGGATDTLSLALTSQPTANVTVSIGGNTDVGVSPTPLTFTPSNWSTPQTVTVAAVNDTLAEGPETASVSFATSSTDSKYNNLAIAPVSVAVTDNEPAPNFSQSMLLGLPDGNYTSLQFGADQRLYVAKVDGTILALTVQETSSGYQVTATETISAIKSITNFNDDGTLAAAQYQGLRQVTGILVTSSPGSPVTIYVSSSDPRIGAGGNGDFNLDTNSGVISRLTQNATGGWDHVELVRGLPRSEENHSVNGMQLSADGKALFVSVGGNTNEGAPSNLFAFLPEYAYSAAIVSIDLPAIDAMATKTDTFGTSYKYNLPTLAPGSSDPYKNDPFGGRDGLSQAVIVNGGPVQIYSSGYRNAYDLVLTSAGKLYTIDNGANAGWGSVPIGEGTANVSNAPNEGGSETPDHLHLVTQGFYAGHPNPIRANPTGAGWYVDGSTTPVSPLPSGWPPVPTANPVEGDFRTPGTDGALYSGWNASTNGLTEYRASTFAGAMTGNLLAVSWDDQLYRVVLSADGASVLSVSPLTGGATVLGGGQPLDVTTTGDNGPFAGAIFVANYGGGITVFKPNGGTSPLPDNDADDDGLLNNVDAFAEDSANGKATDLAAGQTLSWIFSQNVDPPGPNGLFNMGFTGLMSNGVDSYLSLYDPANIKPGGASAGFQIEQVSAGDAAIQNSQQNGFQFGIDVQPTVARFVIESTIDNPFGGSPSTTPINNKSQGFFIGTGTQSDYLKIVAAANGGAGGIQVASETAGAFSASMYGAAITGAGIGALDTITLRLTVDLIAGTATPSWTYTVGGTPSTGNGAPVQLTGATLDALRASYSVNNTPSALAVGIISTSNGSGETFSALWQSIKITADSPALPAPTGLDLAAADDTGASSIDNITVKTSGLTITGVGQNGATVTLYDDLNNNGLKDSNEATLATTTVSSGIFSADIALPNGSHFVRAFQSAQSSGASASSSALNITIDTVPPLSLAITSETLLNNGRLKLSGTAEAGSIVSVSDGAVKLGNTTAIGGTWSFTTTPSDALHVYSIAAVDVAGNTGPGSNVAVVGSSRAESFTGGPGDDFILGRGGADQLNGGAGRDTFYYSEVTDSRLGAGNFDVISNFQHGTDVIDFTAVRELNNIAFYTQTPSNLPGRTLAVVTSGADTLIYANVGSSATSLGNSDMYVLVMGVTNLTASDFLF